MKLKTKLVDHLLNYLANGLNICLGLIMLPFIVTKLNEFEVGLWIVFITITSLINLIEFGFQNTIGRNITYILAGADSISKENLPKLTQKIKSNCSYDLGILQNLMSTVRSIYACMTLIGIIIFLVCGTIYINILLNNENITDKSQYLICWLLVCFGNLIHIYYLYINTALKSSGELDKANIVFIITKTTTIILGISFLYADLGFISLGIAWFAGCLLGRLSSIIFYKRNFVYSKLDLNKTVAISLRKNYFSILWYNACRSGVVQLGTFFIQRFTILVAANALGKQATPYSLTLTILYSVNSLSSVLMQLYLPKITYYQAKRNKKQVKKLFIGTWISVIIISLFINSFLYFYGDEILAIFGSEVCILEKKYLILLIIFIELELIHSIAVSFLTTYNIVPFVKATIISGVLITVINLVFIKEYGVITLILSFGLVNLFYNNWKWPILAIKKCCIK
jgi:O-antigen/teichoic acid export membrane protein